MTATGFCVVAAWSRHTSGLPCTVRCNIGKSLRIASTSSVMPASFPLPAARQLAPEGADNAPPQAVAPQALPALPEEPLHDRLRRPLPGEAAGRHIEKLLLVPGTAGGAV